MSKFKKYCGQVKPILHLVKLFYFYFFKKKNIFINIIYIIWEKIGISCTWLSSQEVKKNEYIMEKEND